MISLAYSRARGIRRVALPLTLVCQELGIDCSFVIEAMFRAFMANRSDQPAYIERMARKDPIYGDWAS